MTDEFYMLSLSLPVLLSDSREAGNDVASTEASGTLRTPLCSEMHSALQHHERKIETVERRRTTNWGISSTVRKDTHVSKRKD